MASFATAGFVSSMAFSLTALVSELAVDSVEATALVLEFPQAERISVEARQRASNSFFIGVSPFIAQGIFKVYYN